MNSFRLTTVKNTTLIYVHSFWFCHIHVYNLIKLYNMSEVDETFLTPVTYAINAIHH